MNMVRDLLLLLYGLCALGAALNFAAWALLLRRRWREPLPERPRRRDPILLTRFGLTMLSFGVTGLAGVRVWGDLFDGSPLTVPRPLALLFIGCMAAAEPFFLRVDELHARSRGTSSRAWRLYWVGAICWTLWIMGAGL